MTFVPELDRRSLLQRMAVLVGVAILPGSSQALAAAIESEKRQLDASHFELLTVLSDTFVPSGDTPGAVAADVPQLVDAILGTWASPTTRAELVAELEAIDSFARDKTGRSLPALSPKERETLLTPYDAAALKTAPPTPPPAVPIGAAPTTVDPNTAKPKQEPVQGSALMQGPRFANPSYGKLKELILVGFYCSETALTHDLDYVHAPGEWRPSIPITPKTRPWGGLGLI